MELSDPSVIVALLEGIERRPGKPRARRGLVGDNTITKAERSRRRCNCGTCAFCKENARWERIFQEKFADPYYYTQRKVKHVSSLSGLG
jgi:hypothetical protein